MTRRLGILPRIWGQVSWRSYLRLFWDVSRNSTEGKGGLLRAGQYGWIVKHVFGLWKGSLENKPGPGYEGPCALCWGAMTFFCARQNALKRIWIDLKDSQKRRTVDPKQIVEITSFCFPWRISSVYNLDCFWYIWRIFSKTCHISFQQSYTLSFSCACKLLSTWAFCVSGKAKKFIPDNFEPLIYCCYDTDRHIWSSFKTW